MKGTLNRLDNGYMLLVDEIIYATDNDKLSKENCDEIFGVVNIDKLAKKEAEKLHDKDKHDDWDIYNSLIYEDTQLIKIGFNKAMELNKDKLFTLEDMDEAIRKAKSYDEIPNHEGVIVSFNYLKEEIIESLQQPTEIEIEVEIEMKSNLHVGEIVDESYPKDFPTSIPKLDKNGCLILKKK